MVDNEELGHKFREQFAEGLRRLMLDGKLRLDGEWSKLRDPAQREAWLDKLTATDWNVFIEGPPHGQSQPEHVLKYLARYMTGGPISDRRLISDEDGVVTFWARSKEKRRGKSTGNRSERFSLRGIEFVRRWSMHILPKGYTRSRSYGGYHGSKREAYLARCRELLDITTAEDTTSAAEPIEELEQSLPKCDHCEVPMVCIAQQGRPSWKHVFEHGIYIDPALYSPQHHIQAGLATAYPIDEYG